MYFQVNKYEPKVLWLDGDWEAESKYWRSCEFLSWLYSDSSVKESVVTNDRWGRDAQCKHGDILNCADRYLPGKNVTKSQVQCKFCRFFAYPQTFVSQVIAIDLPLISSMVIGVGFFATRARWGLQTWLGNWYGD